MSRKLYFGVVLLSVASSAAPAYGGWAPTPVTMVLAQKEPAPPFLSADQLRAKLARNEPVTIIDVRDSQSYLNNNKIKGSIHVKLRRLSYRLTMPPLKNTPRDREIVTYCACQQDEASIRAAQIITAAGFKRVYVLQGGWRMWLKVNGQTEPRPKAG